MRTVWTLVMTGMLLAGCGRSGTATAPSTGDKIKQDVKALGHDIKDAATQAASEVKPALHEAKDKGQQMIHDGAQKVAEMTATQPASNQAK
ncbi:MAG TPA: hypothetical protein VHM90_07515, partial [Phycisphaerae bacterium]|nr:hypothetical protein [Phycisphaerae bacterium]